MIKSPNRRHSRQYFYKYMSAQTAKIVLVNRTLRLSSPLVLNDPFDVARVLRIPFLPEEVNASIALELSRMVREQVPSEQNHSELVRNLRAYAAGLTTEQRDFLAETLGRNDTNTDLTKLPSFAETQEAWSKMMPQTRILSLAQEYDNTVMWNTYSQKYTGVVLELECLDLYDSVLLLAEAVTYSDDPPSLGTLEYWVKMITGQQPFDYNRLFKKLEMTKATKWSYENEWRVVSFDKNSKETYSDYGMHPRTFTKVFLGKDISAEDRQDLMGLALGFPHMEILEMEIDQNSQRLAFKKAQTT